jgi:hypothetical protein
MRFSSKRCCISATAWLSTRYEGMVFLGNLILCPFKTVMKTQEADKKLGLNHQQIEF